MMHSSFGDGVVPPLFAFRSAFGFDGLFIAIPRLHRLHRAGQLLLKVIHLHAEVIERALHATLCGLAFDSRLTTRPAASESRTC